MSHRMSSLHAKYIIFSGVDSRKEVEFDFETESRPFESKKVEKTDNSTFVSNLLYQAFFSFFLFRRKKKTSFKTKINTSFNNISLLKRT